MGAFAADAIVSVAEAVLGRGALGDLRFVVSAAAFLLCHALFAAYWISPRVSPVFGVLPAAFLWWVGLGAMPLPFAFQPAEIQGALALLQLGLACWLLHEAAGVAPVRRSPSLLRSLGIGAALAATLVVVVPLHAPLWLGWWLQTHTDRFVSFDARGVTLEQRRFTRDGKSIDLVGMMHLGESSAYRDLFASFETPDTVVLTEGLTDEDRRLDFELPYVRLAAPLGLDVQPRVEETLAARPDETDPDVWPHLRSADLDARDLSAETVSLLRRIGAAFEARSVAARMRALALAGQMDEEAGRRLTADLIELRNAHLIDELDAVLPRYARIVVPWGALHMPGIEAAVRARGFELEASSRRHLVRWATLLAVLFDRS